MNETQAAEAVTEAPHEALKAQNIALQQINAKYQAEANEVTKDLAENHGDAAGELALQLHALAQVRQSVDGLALLADKLASEHEETEVQQAVAGERYVAGLRLDQLREELTAGRGAYVMTAVNDACRQLADIERAFEQEAAALMQPAAPAPVESATAGMEQMGT